MVTASPVLGVIAIAAVVVFIFIGIPIAFSLGLSAIILLIIFTGSPAMTALQSGLTAWSWSSNYSMSMLPLFILMGTVVAQSGLGNWLYDAFYKWMYKIKGGLAIATIWACAAFGTVTGSGLATIASIGTISNPEMKKRGYSATLRMGAISNGSLLAPLIPPSTTAIMYAILVDVSPAKVLMAGLLPGIVLAVMFSIIIYFWVLLKPASAPMGVESFTFRQKISSTGRISPVVLLFLIIIGGMYTGFFSPTEAAGIGTILAIVIAYIWRVLKWNNFKRALTDGVKISGFVLMIILASSLFSRAVAMSHLADLIYSWLNGLGGGNSYVLIVVVTICFLILGCFLDNMAILMLFVPLFYPIVTQAGFNGIWFGVLVMQSMNVAMMTPPLAPCIFVTQALNPDSTMVDVLKGSLPFYIANIGILFVLIWVPGLAMLIPNTM